MKFWKPFALAAAGTLALASAFSALAADKKVVVGEARRDKSGSGCEISCTG